MKEQLIRGNLNNPKCFEKELEEEFENEED